MNSSYTHTGAEGEETRLDAWLTVQMAKTRSQVQRDIRDGIVTVSGIVVIKPGTVLHKGDEVVIAERIRDPEKKNGPKLTILFEDDVLLVINKPHGTVVHPGSGVKDGTIVDSILARTDASFDVRAGLVHRLDKDTSGVLVVAKSSEMLHLLQQQWQKRSVKKEYIALLVGQLEPAEGSVEAPIARHHSDRKKMSVGIQGRAAVTKYKVEKYFNAYTLVRLDLVTGRTHQIRVHMSAIGFPVAGDTTYGDKHANELLSQKGLKRQFLHAQRITLHHPRSEKEMTFEAPVPIDLQRVLDVLE